MGLRTTTRLLTGLAAAVLVLVGCEYEEIDGIGTRTADEEHPPQADLMSFAGCERGELERWVAKGEITNNAPVVSTYEVTVAFYDGDTRVAERSDWIRDLKPGETAQVHQGWWLGEAADSVTDCSVLTINRWG